MTNPTLHGQVPASSAVLKAIREANMQLVRTGDDAFMLVTLKQPAPQQGTSPTAGMNIAQRILHVGGRNNAAGYVEFGSTQAVEALVKHMLRDLHPSPAAQGDVLDAARYRFLRDGEWRDTDLEPFIRLQLNMLWDAKIDAARAAQEGKSHE